MSSIVCKNCSHHFKGNYCPNCSQSAKVEPIGVKYFLHDIPHSILHIDRGFFYTLSKLFTSPGKTLAEYLEGKRVKHFRPFAFVLIMSTICSLLISGIETVINNKLISSNAGIKVGLGNNFFGKYPSILIFILIPLLSFITWIIFHKRKYNFWEHCLINTYVAAFVNIFFLLVKIYQFIKFEIFSSLNVNYVVFMTLFMTYYGFTFGVLMKEKNNRLKVTLQLSIMTFSLAFVYMTAFSLIDVMTPWWSSK